MVYTKRFVSLVKSINATEKWHILNDSSHLDKFIGRKHVCVGGIFRLQIATIYHKVVFLDNGLLCPRSKQNTFHKLFTELYVLQKHTMYETNRLT